MAIVILEGGRSRILDMDAQECAIDEFRVALPELEDMISRYLLPGSNRGRARFFYQSFLTRLPDSGSLLFRGLPDCPRVTRLPRVDAMCS